MILIFPFLYSSAKYRYIMTIVSLKIDNQSFYLLFIFIYNILTCRFPFQSIVFIRTHIYPSALTIWTSIEPPILINLTATAPFTSWCFRHFHHQNDFCSIVTIAITKSIVLSFRAILPIRVNFITICSNYGSPARCFI